MMMAPRREKPVKPMTNIKMADSPFSLSPLSFVFLGIPLLYHHF